MFPLNPNLLKLRQATGTDDQFVTEVVMGSSPTMTESMFRSRYESKY